MCPVSAAKVPYGWNAGGHLRKIILRDWRTWGKAHVKNETIRPICLVELSCSQHGADSFEEIYPVNAATILNWEYLVKEDDYILLLLVFFTAAKMDCSLTYILPGSKLSLTRARAIFLKEDKVNATPTYPNTPSVIISQPKQFDAHVRAYHHWRWQENSLAKRGAHSMQTRRSLDNCPATETCPAWDETQKPQG